MQLTVLGAGTALPVPGRSPAGYLLGVGGEPLLFDLGPGTPARLAEGRRELPGARARVRLPTVFVCECSFPRGWPTPDHVTAGGAGRMARAAGVRRLVLSHLCPPAQDVDVKAQARAEYEGEVVVAVGGTTVTV